MTAPSPVPAMPAYSPKSGFAAASVLVCVALMILLGWVLPAGWNFVVVVVLMLAVALALGQAIVGRPFGVLVNEQNVMSLSRFQMVLWTVAVLAAYFTYALQRMKAGAQFSDALAVGIDWHLWALMGISTTSLVGSPLILNTKKDKDPAPTVTAKAAASLGEDPAVVDSNRQGLVYANSTKRDAQFVDMFQGDEIGNTSHIDLTKLQMFYFTVIAVVAFVVMTARNVGTGADLSALPTLPDGLVALLGISHAGYLTGKGITRTAVE